MSKISKLPQTQKRTFKKKRVNRHRFRRYSYNTTKNFLRKTFVLSLLILFCCLGYNLFFKSDHFRVKNFEIKGNHYASAPEILSIVEEQSPMNIFLIIFSDLREKLKKIKWIERVSFESEIPDTLIIQVKERTPVALIVMKGDLYLIDKEGVLIDRFLPDYALFHLPIINGVGDISADDYKIRLNRGLEVARLLSYGKINLLNEISEIDISRIDDVYLISTHQGTEIFLGRGNFREKLLNYKNLRKKIYSENPNIAYIDLRIKDKITVHPYFIN